MMVSFQTLIALVATLHATAALATGCPFANVDNLASPNSHPHPLKRSDSSRNFLADFEIDDANAFMTTDAGGPVSDQDSLRAGERGPTLLEDFIFREKITRFDHERVPERAVHARGAGAFGVFTSAADFSNTTAASFLGAAGKATPVFVRFSTVAGSRGSADTARDVHGFATRFYTNEGNFDLVGNNVPVFFIQDAIQFPDLIHAVKPVPDREIPQSATAHDSAWDFFSQQPSALHTLFWAMSGHGIVRSYRHMDGFGVHTFRLVTAEGNSTLVKWHWKTRQGRASLVWDEAQQVAGKNADFHRQDLWDAIEAGNGPEWDLCVQMVAEEDAGAFGIDLLDPTKILPVELAPLHKLGVMKLTANPVNYFAETEQIMFQPGHIVRGVDFTEDPLLQGRVFSYLDTQINRHGGPNFEQLPINRPLTPIHNNHRDGAGQMFIHRNSAPYSPNTLNNDNPKQAGKNAGKGFITAPIRGASGALVRGRPDSFKDFYTQPRLFYNSISPAERQALINAIRFETSHIQSAAVKENVIKQLNKVSNQLASLVAPVLGLEAPEPDDAYYHTNTTSDVGAFGEKLHNISGLVVGIMVDDSVKESLSQAADLKSQLAPLGLVVKVVGTLLSDRVDTTYSSADATAFDGVIFTQGTHRLIAPKSSDRPTLFPAGRPAQILTDAFRWGKPVGLVGNDTAAAAGAEVTGEGVYVRAGGDLDRLVGDLEEGLAVFRFVDRFGLDDGVDESR